MCQSMNHPVGGEVRRRDDWRGQAVEHQSSIPQEKTDKYIGATQVTDYRAITFVLKSHVLYVPSSVCAHRG